MRLNFLSFTPSFSSVLRCALWVCLSTWQLFSLSLSLLRDIHLIMIVSCVSCTYFFSIHFLFLSCVLFRCEHNFKYLGTHNIQLHTLISVNPLAFGMHTLCVLYTNVVVIEHIEKRTSQYTSKNSNNNNNIETEEEGSKKKIKIKRRRK